MNLSNGNDKKSKTSGVASLFGRGSASKIGKSQFSRSMGGIMERLKGLSRRDLAMVGVGLSVLVAAPVAEYMMSKPADSANMLTSGFSSRDSQSGSASLYEPGINALSQGSADGAGEVITPLSARDPSSLILGAQSDQPPMIDYTPMGGGEGAGGDSSSSSSSSSPDMDDMRDSVRDAARNGASEAVKSAGAPTVIPRMAAGFRGLGSIASAGGTSSSGDSKRKLSAPTKSNVSAKQSTMVNPVASAGYKGVANTPKTGNKNAIEKLRAQGDAQGGYFSGANAIKALDNANGVKISDIHGDGPGSGFGGGSMGGGEGYKGPSHGGPHDSHKHSGKCQTLACQAAEARQKKALEWEFFWRYDVPKKIAETFINALTKGAADWLVGKIFGGKGGPTEYVCLAAQDKSVVPMCKKDNLVEVARTKDEETYKSWKTGGGDQCPCGKPPASEVNLSDENHDSSGHYIAAEGSFEAMVSSYDEGLRIYMAKLSETSRTYRSDSMKKAAGDAYASLDMYMDMGKQNNGESLAFGGPFSKINKLVKEEGKTLTEELTVLRSTVAVLAGEFSSAKAKGIAFKLKLKDIEEHPNNYTKKSSSDNIKAVGSEDKEDPLSVAVKAYYEEYSRTYDRVITVPESEKIIERHGLAIDILKNYTREAANENDGINEVVFNDYTTQVGELKRVYTDESKSFSEQTIKKLNLKHDDIKNRVYEYLVEVDAAPDAPKDKVTDGGSRDVPTDPNKASAKARIWRGLPWNLEDQKKEKNMLEVYKDEAAKVKQREIDHWKLDSPREIKNNNNSILREYSELQELASKGKSTMLEYMEANNSREFYAPGYRVIVEIRESYNAESNALAYIQTEIQKLKQLEINIKQELKNQFNIDLEGGNGGNQGGGDNGGNGGNQDGGNNGNNGNNDNNGNNNNNNGNNNNNSQQSIAPSVCVNPDHCTDAEIRKLEKEARQSGKYNKGNKELNPVWNEYKNPVSGMEKVTVNPEGGATYQDYNNGRGKVHTLRNQYDQLASQLKNSANLSQAERDAIKDEMDRVYENYEQELENTNRMWKEVCVASVKQGYSKVSMNYCNGKGGAVNHNTTNTTVPKPTNTTPSSTKPTTDNGQTSKSTGKVPDVLQDIILVNKPQVVPVYDAENNKITVKVCDGLLSEGFPDVCLSYADIRSGANTCFMYTEKDACNRVRNGQLKGWPQKQVDKYGKLIAKKNRKLDGTWHKVQVTATVFDYSLRHSDARNTHMDAPQPLPRLNGTADKEFGANFSSEKKMEEFIFRTNAYCAYNKNSNSWHFKKVTLTAEEGTSSNSIGGSLNVSADVLAVKVSATATYNHSKTTYNFGKEMNYSQNFAGKICK